MRDPTKTIIYTPAGTTFPVTESSDEVFAAKRRMDYDLDGTYEVLHVVHGNYVVYPALFPREEIGVIVNCSRPVEVA